MTSSSLDGISLLRKRKLWPLTPSLFIGSKLKLKKPCQIWKLKLQKEHTHLAAESRQQFYQHFPSSHLSKRKGGHQSNEVDAIGKEVLQENRFLFYSSPPMSHNAKLHFLEKRLSFHSVGNGSIQLRSSVRVIRWGRTDRWNWGGPAWEVGEPEKCRVPGKGRHVLGKEEWAVLPGAPGSAHKCPSSEKQVATSSPEKRAFSVSWLLYSKATNVF